MKKWIVVGVILIVILVAGYGFIARKGPGIDEATIAALDAPPQEVRRQAVSVALATHGLYGKSWYCMGQSLPGQT